MACTPGSIVAEGALSASREGAPTRRCRGPFFYTL